MTVVPAGNRAALLICNRCGAEETAANTSHHSDLVWPMVAQMGWTGSAFPTGSHNCPACSGPAEPADHAPDPVVRTHGASYAVRRGEDATFVTPLTDFDAALAEVLREDLMLAAENRRYLIVDLHSVGFIDSTALGLLVRARQEVRRHGGRLGLVAPSRFVRTVLHTMRLDAAFPCYPDQGAALRGMRATDGQEDDLPDDTRL
ncbi:STAS domain-containing protein [Actinoplanes sp. TRM 88003]|uniref:Anti-sigma factor antagonist n=1 Tax=Paractinoplanes aksuensis TaxID=2939490 RepID=A0ABT1E3D9_9ACTN|nr:STAS domain-containing protein [Actinoplanes aksuensis]MCO8277652.1 STAS domain-containing protein [Actinoplanes aksuensis]